MTPKDSYIYGASGHGKVVLATAKVQDIEITRFFDDATELWDKTIENVLISGPPHHSVNCVIGIGNNKIREGISQKFPFEWFSLIHPTAYVHESVKIGKGTVVFAHAVIQPGTVIGDHVIINTGAIIDHDCFIESFVHIAPGCALAGNVTVEQGAFLGIGVRVIPGKKIGAWSTIGAGGVVISDIEPNLLAVGIPAKIKRKINNDK